MKRLPEAESNLRLDAAGAGEAPAGERLVDGEKPGDHKNQAQPKVVIHQNDPRDEEERAADAAGDAALPLDVGLEETTHDENLTHRISVASGA